MRLDALNFILGFRKLAKGGTAKWSILIKANDVSNSFKLEVRPIDMSSYASVGHICQGACSTLSRLDAVISNAGVESIEFEITEGLESTLTFNLIFTFLLAYLFLSKLCETANRTVGTRTQRSSNR